VVETDSTSLIAQLNLCTGDLPSAMLTRWIAWIRLFEFDVKHIAGKKHTAADGLSRRPPSDGEFPDNEDMDEFIEKELNCVNMLVSEVEFSTGYIMPLQLSKEDKPLEGKYAKHHQNVAIYLLTMAKPPSLSGLSRKDYTKFRRDALTYLVQGRQLFKRASRNIPLRRVIDDIEEQEMVLKRCHEASGHRSESGTYSLVAGRYWWKDMFQSCRRWVQGCKSCQLRSSTRKHEPLHPTFSSIIGERVHIDVVHMPPFAGYHYLIHAREDISGWIEGKALRTATAANCAKFIWESIITRHGCPKFIVMDGGPENKGEVVESLQRWGVVKIEVSPYNPQANGVVEGGHRPIIMALSKLSLEGLGNWVDNLHGVYLADRATTRQSTGFTPFRLMHGYEPVLPVDLEFPTWKIVEWGQIRETSELLAMRTRQLLRLADDIRDASDFQKRMRLAGKEAFDEAHTLKEALCVGDLVLEHITEDIHSHSVVMKFAARWRGPFRIRSITESGSYVLEELNGVQRRKSTPPSRIKRFRVRDIQEVLTMAQEEREESLGNVDMDLEERRNEAPEPQPDYADAPDGTGWQQEPVVFIPRFEGDLEDYENGEHEPYN